MFRCVCKPAAIFKFVNYCKSPRCERKLSTASQMQITLSPSGLTVATEEVMSPLACVSLFILTGSRFENDCYNGISYFIEHMAYKGFKSMSQRLIISKLNSIGAKLSAYTNREYQCFTGIAPADSMSEVVAIISQIVSDIEFSEEEVSNAKVKIRSKLLENDNNPKRIVFDYLHQTAFQGTPLAQSITPSSSNLNNFDCNSAVGFMKENYINRRMVLAVSGGVSHDATKIVTEKYLAWDPNYRCSRPFSVKRYTGSQIIYRNDSLPSLHVAIAVEVPGYNSADYLALLVASYLTDSWDKSQGGNLNHASLLARASDTAHLCERFQSFYTAYSDVGLWGVYFVGPMNVSDEMVSSIQDCWMRLCTTTSNNDVERAVNKAKVKLAKNVNGVINSCHDIGLQVLLTGRRKSLDILNKELSCISSTTLKNVGYKYIYDKCPAVAAVGPSEVLPDYERIRAGMYWLRL